MPGVRYGPDIADDAAYVMNTLVELRRTIPGLKGAKLRDARVEQEKMKKIANEIFGVRPSDIDRGRYGALAQLAQYSIGGRNPQGKAYNRSKLAKSWRTKKLMKRQASVEFEKRGEKGGRQTVSSVGLGGAAERAGGATYLGRTKTRKFDQLAEAAYARAKRRGYIKESTAGAFDKAGGSGGIARQGPRLPGVGQAYGATGKAGTSIRPPTRKSARGTARRQAAAEQRRAEKIAAEGKAAAKKLATPKKSTKPKAPSKPKTPKRG